MTQSPEDIFLLSANIYNTMMLIHYGEIILEYWHFVPTATWGEECGGGHCDGGGGIGSRPFTNTGKIKS